MINIIAAHPIEAFQITDDNDETTKRTPRWLLDLIISGQLKLINEEKGWDFTLGKTKIKMAINDWIIKDILTPYPVYYPMTNELFDTFVEKPHD